MSVFLEPKSLIIFPHHAVGDGAEMHHKDNLKNGPYRTKPDLRLAESYIPALILCIKCMLYTSIAPTILLVQWKVTVMCVAFSCFLLYVDHLYFVMPSMVFIDTTAIALDVLGATLLVMVMVMLKPCTQQCQGILALWALFSAVYLLVPYHIPKPCIHLAALFFLLSFIYTDLGLLLGAVSPSQGNATHSGSPMPPLQPATISSLGFFARTAFYTSLIIVDVYLFRPLFQRENERLLFCKYGPVLLGAWPWCLIFWIFLLGIQAIKFFQPFQRAQAPTSLLPTTTHHGAAPPPLSTTSNGAAGMMVQDMDVLEAFRLAQKQHMGSKAAN